MLRLAQLIHSALTTIPDLATIFPHTAPYFPSSVVSWRKLLLCLSSGACAVSHSEEDPKHRGITLFSPYHALFPQNITLSFCLSFKTFLLYLPATPIIYHDHDPIILKHLLFSFTYTYHFMLYLCIFAPLPEISFSLNHLTNS